MWTTYSYSRVLGTVLDYHIGQVLGLGLRNQVLGLDLGFDTQVLGLESLVLGLGFGLAGQVLVNITGVEGITPSTVGFGCESINAKF